MHEAREISVRWFRRASCSPGVALALLLAVACVVAGRPQSAGSNGGQPSMHSPFSDRQDLGALSSDDYDPVMMERRLNALNIGRQKQMVADANELLKLAKELNDEVAAENTGTLTPEELHQIAEIERLARSVKERMVMGVGQPPPVMPPPVIIYPDR